ncbi:glyoxal reductase [Linnemannia elongata AG-77]|uniref:Glyoxal reductase n=1 Tax=Linnemannia elongata AG-77 TaxID=1314771 RepID=A0A197K9A2_9FUNG|nr:glyoxal reductase [Linnemannia elongata AG-77]
MTRVELTGLQSSIKLSSGHSIPRLGLGVYQAEEGRETENAVLWALQAGYRHIDTATIYGNETSVGNAIRKSGVPRNEIFVTTKLTEDDQGYETTLAACTLSLKKLGLDYIDLYLIHSPLCGSELRLQSWKAMEKLQADGKVKSIGVSNYGVHHLKELLDDPDVTIRPAVNQIEVHPWLTRTDIVSFCKENNIAVESYSPLVQAHKLQDPTLNKIASTHSKTPAQVLIRWNLQRGNIVIPKSSKKERIIENADVFGFELSEEEVEELAALNENYVTEWDPTVAP